MAKTKCGPTWALHVAEHFGKHIMRVCITVPGTTFFHGQTKYIQVLCKKYWALLINNQA